MLGLSVAASLARADDWLAAAAVTGTTGLLISPVSWTHHWVWIMPVLIVLLRDGAASRVAAGCGYLLFVLAPMWWTPHPGDNAQYGFHGLITVTANSFMLAGVGFLVFMAGHAWRTRPSRRTGSRFPAHRPAPAAPRVQRPKLMHPRSDRVMTCPPASRDVRCRYIVIVSREIGGDDR